MSFRVCGFKLEARALRPKISGTALNARPQKHPKHYPIHSADKLRRRRLPLGNRLDRSRRPRTYWGRTRIRLRV